MFNHNDEWILNGLIQFVHSFRHLVHPLFSKAACPLAIFLINSPIRGLLKGEKDGKFKSLIRSYLEKER